MIRLVGSEFFKLRSTRTFYALVGSALGLVLLLVVLITSLASFGPHDQPLEDMLGLTGFVQAFVRPRGLGTPAGTHAAHAIELAARRLPGVTIDERLTEDAAEGPVTALLRG